jgi:hypothetical protein
MGYRTRLLRSAALLLCIAPCLSLSGCAAVGLYGVGKVYLDKERAPIYVTENVKEIAGCEFVNRVEASTAWGGPVLQDEALERVISDITHDASRAGANILLIKSTSKGFLGSSASGAAYRCNNPPSAPLVVLHRQGS